MNGYCEECNYCHINAMDDTELWCEKGGYAIECGTCDDFEKRDDGLVLTRVWDWR